MCSAVSLRAVDVGDTPPEELDAPGGLNLTQRQRTLLDPYFRNALWYYDAYHVYFNYSKGLEDLNISQGQDIDVLLEEAVNTKIKNACLIVITVVSTTVTIVLAFMVKALL